MFNRLIVTSVLLCLGIGFATLDGSVLQDIESYEDVEQFLEQLYTINQDVFELGIDLDHPSEKYYEYLADHFSNYCTEDVIEQLLSMRVPFSIMKLAKEGNYNISVDDIIIEPIDSTSTEVIGLNFRVLAHSECIMREDQEQMEYSGRVTIDLSKANGRIISIRIDNLFQ